MDIDYLIVGQGLAGSLIAWELIQRQKKIIIVDNGQDNASLIAAGLINPITGMRFVKAENIEQLLSIALDSYQQLSDYFRQPFYIERSMLRILRNKQELHTCQQRLQDTQYQKYLTEIIASHLHLNTPNGSVKQNFTGYLLTQPLLHALKQYFISHNAYFKTEIDYSEIRLTPTLQWKSFRPKKIIFCEGYRANANPWFSWLPFQLVKGEIITATTSQELPQDMLNYGHWLIPLSSDKFRTGATFDRENLNTNTTEQAKQSLLNSLNKYLPDFTLDESIKQQAGIRPTTRDKRPFIGCHPNQPELVIFNGFGSKGSLQIPWHSQCLADNLTRNIPIPQSCNILRYHQMFNSVQRPKQAVNFKK